VIGWKPQKEETLYLDEDIENTLAVAGISMIICEYNLSKMKLHRIFTILHAKAIVLQ